MLNFYRKNEIMKNKKLWKLCPKEQKLLSYKGGGQNVNYKISSKAEVWKKNNQMGVLMKRWSKLSWKT